MLPLQVTLVAHTLPCTEYSPSPAPRCATDQLQSSELKFLPLAEWDEGGEYDEQPPRYICYTIAWKLILNRMTIGRVTEGDLVIAASDYWGQTLKADVEEMLQTKKKRYQRVRSEGMAITVSVNDRSQGNLKFYNSTKINRKPLEKQLHKWNNLLCIGKRFTIEIAFNYRCDDDGHSMRSRRVEKRGRVSATSNTVAIKGLSFKNQRIKVMIVISSDKRQKSPCLIRIAGIFPSSFPLLFDTNFLIDPLAAFSFQKILGNKIGIILERCVVCRNLAQNIQVTSN